MIPVQGPALYAARWFTQAGGEDASRIAKWNSSTQTWSALGPFDDGPINAMPIFNDGSGPAIYVGGHFFNVDGIYANSIVRWNGTAWSSVGPALFAGGEFDHTADNAVLLGHVAKWNGTWSPLGRLKRQGIADGSIEGPA
jgi:hypothetical protein